MTGWLIGGVWAVVLVPAPFVGRLLRKRRQGSTGPPVVWDRHGDAWDRNRDGTYRLRADNSDQHLQAMELDDIEQAFGPITLTPHTEQDTAS